jgi:DNA-binding NarL/FixJ family response regulator
MIPPDTTRQNIIPWQHAGGQEHDVFQAVHDDVISKQPSQSGGVECNPAAIWIVGKNTFQNNLLKPFLEKNPDPPMAVTIAASWLPSHQQQATRNTLVLWDCFGSDGRDIWTKLSLGGGPDAWSLPVALFNVAPSAGTDFERQAIEKHIRGVFYLNDPPEFLLRGIRKILQGEIWYSRKVTSEVLLEGRRSQPDTEMAEAMLTSREKEILIAIAGGAGNSEIAAELCISLHTVKSHIYNIYKKIDVGNRLEATLWVARYL